MKIVHLMGSLRSSGMERMFISAAPYFQGAGIETVIVGQGNEHPFQSELETAGYRIASIPSLRSVDGGRGWMSILKAERPDVVHIHTERAFAVSAVAAKVALPKTPIVRTVHSYFQPSGKALVSRKVQALVADRCINRFIAISPDVQENERNFNRDPVLIFNWVEDRFFRLREERNTVRSDEKNAAVIVGNSSWIKNQALALKAVRDNDLDLYFHGDESGASPEEKDILDELESLGRLRHRGVSDPAPSLLKGAVFLMPSRFEGMGVALAEALVTGVPAVVSDAPGMRWAREFPNVMKVQPDEVSWHRALQLFSSPNFRSKLKPAEAAIDLSAHRGVGELVRTYQEVL